ncbi:MAG: hypothetical protein JJE29_01085 [Peptostreptococcaceae bacterium]|nr:hypothetical protein [Peptostreptococcaceae bacterium]
MPQINRIRIINFSYNNNNRNILDETFDFYQGENALLSLKNGGGKSVLVQLLFQPIIPKSKLMGRRIEDFFIGRNTPSYVMIEWKLEDEGGYLLTGIGLANRIARGGEGEEPGNNVKYFTFTSAYRNENAFDIVGIPLVEKHGNGISIEEFREAKRIIGGKEKASGSDVRMFTEEDAVEYRRYLESYNIFRDEWKSIVLKINESEGGVIEIFEKCKTSQILMNEWILKSIEKVVNKEDRDQNMLEKMLENLVEEMIDNEAYIYEKEIYHEFLKDTEDHLIRLDELMISIDKEKEIEDSMARMYGSLLKRLGIANKETETQRIAISACKEELNRITLEERSKEYYDALDKVGKLSRVRAEKEEELKAAEKELENNKRGIAVQEAARGFARIKALKQAISIIKEKIGKIKNDGDNRKKIKNLEYSLRIAYEKALEKLRGEIDGASLRKKEIESEIGELDEVLRAIGSNTELLQRKLGGAENKVKDFLIYEKKAAEALSIKYERNLLGEIENDYYERYSLAAENELNNLKEEKADIDGDVVRANEREVQIEKDLEEKRQSGQDAAVEFSRLAGKIEDYRDKEEAVKPLLERYEIDFRERFRHGENSMILCGIIKELEKKEREIDLDVRVMRENIDSLRDGSLHVSKEFKQWLINHDIGFETGENYLRKQKPERRGALTSKNPMLPFSFLLYEDDIASIGTMEIGIDMHQMVPIMSYGDVKNKFDSEGNLLQVQDGIRFICLYDEKMIDTDNLEIYMEEKKRELKEIEGKLGHYREELNCARNDAQELNLFAFDENYAYELEKKNESALARIASIDEETIRLGEERDRIKKRLKECRERIVEIGSLAKECEARKRGLGEFIEKEKGYQASRQLVAECENGLRGNKKERERKEKEKDCLGKEKESIGDIIMRLGMEIKDKEKGYACYAEAVDGELLDDDLESMEGRLRVLHSKISLRLEELEKELEEKFGELKEKETMLEVCELKESEYRDVAFDLKRLKELKVMGRALEASCGEADEALNKAYGSLKHAEGMLETAQKEILKLTDVILERSSIKMNFEGRRETEVAGMRSAEKRIIELEKICSECRDIISDIKAKINIGSYSKDAGYEIVISFREDFGKLEMDLRDVKAENEKLERNAEINYGDMKNEFVDKNVNLKKIFDGLGSLVQKARSNKDDYYYLWERMTDSKEILDKLIKVCEQMLSSFEKTKRDMIQHSYMHGKQVYDEIQKIGENSSIKLEGKSRPVPMLKIDMEPLEAVEKENIDKMKMYIENCIGIIKEDMKENKKIEDVRKKIHRYMSTKELLNVLSDMGKMTVRAYKIDVNSRNNRYKTWEQVIKENSGGERFVSFFAVLVALMSYTRTSLKLEDDYRRNRDTKVLVMDNPFGPISSEHLLKPLFKIAEKYNTQLICLTDLKQNSILNCFNLIYMIKIRKSVFGTSEYIQVERQIKNGAEMEQDEKLEKAVMMSQISF